MRVESILLLATLALTYTPTYSTYSSIYISNPTYLSMSNDGSVYSCINNNALEYYRKINNIYTLRSRVYMRCTASGVCTPSRQQLSYDGLRILAYSSNDNTMLNVYKIINQTIVFSQAIVSTSQKVSFFILRQNFLLLYYPLIVSFDYYKYNSATGLYQSIVSSSFITSAFRAAISSDGHYLIGLTSTLTMYVSTYDGTNFVESANGSAIPMPAVNGSATNVLDVRIQQLNSTTYALVILYLAGGTSLLQYYAMVGGVASFVQQLDESSLIETIYLTKNAKYLLSSLANSTIKMYQFDGSTNRYICTYTFTNFYSGYPLPIYIAEDASFLFGVRTEAALYFACTLPYCAVCSTLGQCLVCAATFTLTPTNTCACTSVQSLVGSSCVSCTVSQCGACSAANICSGCANGYSLVGNSCVCPTNSTVSLNSSCVSCNVANCYRCDQPDLCALFSSAQPTTDTQQIGALSQQLTAGTQQVAAVSGKVDLIQNGVTAVQQKVAANSGLSTAEAATLGLLAVILIALSAGLIYLAIKVKSLTDSFSRLHSEYANPPNQSLETLANYQPIMKSNSGVEQAVARRKRRARNQEFPLQEVASMQKFVENELK